jgi:hypothetical protein
MKGAAMTKIVRSHQRVRNGPRTRHAALFATTALLAGALVNVTAYAPLALANTACGHDQPIKPNPRTGDPGTYNFVGWTWTPAGNDVEGVRAPILIRLDGSLCANTTHTAFATAWIAIQDQNSQGITQIGYDRHFNSDGSTSHCRFWAIGTGAPHYYDCDDSNGTFVYFRIVQYLIGANPFYMVEDCGTASGGFNNNCTTENATQAAYAAPQGAVFSETDYGDSLSGCPTQMLGDNTNPVLYGNSSWDLNGKNSSGWATRGWVFNGPFGCSGDYKGETTFDGVGTWDSRNTS